MFHTCGLSGPATAHRDRPIASDGSKSLTVDIHCHCQCYPVSEMMREQAELAGHAALAFGNPVTKSVNEKQLVDIAPKMQSLEERISDMDRMGVDVQAISVPPYQLYYWADPEVGRDASRQLNDHLAGMVARQPDRLVALGTLPLQNMEMALAELDRCIGELGMRGVEISTIIENEELSSPRLEPFFARAEELDIVIFIHPKGFTHGERFKEHYFINLIGHPIESSLAIGHLIFDGTLERYPGLKICVAHGGGYVPAYGGRMDHGYHARADCRQHISQPPSIYLKKFFFDTMVFEPNQLRYLIETYGPDHVLLGTDYPYDMGENDPLALVGNVDGLTDADRAAIGGLNAARLLKLTS